jgi:hypothetical protein
MGRGHFPASVQIGTGSAGRAEMPFALRLNSLALSQCDFVRALELDSVRVTGQGWLVRSNEEP